MNVTSETLKGFPYDTWLVFITAARSESFLQASRALSMEAASVSRKMHALEEALDTQLFYRDSDGIFLTTAGQDVYSEVFPVFDEIRKIKESFSQSEQKFSGKISVELPEFLFVSRVRHLFSAMEFSDPDTVISVHPFASVRDGSKQIFRPDLCLSPSFSRSGNVVGAIPLLLLASGTYLNNFGVPRSPEELLRHSLLSGLFFCKRHSLVFESDEERISVPFTPLQVTRLVSSCIDGALAGAGIAAAVPAVSAEEFIRSGELVQVLPLWRLPPLYIGVEASPETLKKPVVIELLSRLKKLLSEESHYAKK